jgi:serine/threonine protein kinase
MSERRPGDDAKPVLPPSLTNSGSAPTIDPSVPATEPTGTDLPERLGRFIIRGFLGAGAFGTVYRAYDPQLDREVALKVARSAGQSKERLQRFRREARAAAGLRHPHIVPLFEAGEADGHLYLASAFVPGLTLEEALEKNEGRRFPPEQAAVIVRKLADALAYAHGQGVLHRDVKSANVMLDPAGQPHLLDFGLARRAEDQERMTLDGSVLGTAAYLAPEAARGGQERWTPAVDQYARGVVLYELLTGHTPFTGPVELVLALHQTQEPERPSRRHNQLASRAARPGGDEPGKGGPALRAAREARAAGADVPHAALPGAERAGVCLFLLRDGKSCPPHPGPGTGADRGSPEDCSG